MSTSRYKWIASADRFAEVIKQPLRGASYEGPGLYNIATGYQMERGQGEVCAPMVLRDLSTFSMQDGTEISSRSQLREYQKRNGVEQVGLDYTSSDKPVWFDAYKDYRKEARRRRKDGKAMPKFVAPVAAPERTKNDHILVHSDGGYDRATLRKLA